MSRTIHARTHRLRGHSPRVKEAEACSCGNTTPFSCGPRVVCPTCGEVKVMHTVMGIRINGQEVVPPMPWCRDCYRDHFTNNGRFVGVWRPAAA